MLAYRTNEPFWFDERDVAVNLIDPRNYGIEFYGDNLFTSETEVRDHPERTRKVRDASLKGWQYALAHPDEIIELILAEYNGQGHSRAHLAFEAEQIRKLILPDFVELGRYEMPRLTKTMETYRRLELTEMSDVPPGFLLSQFGPDVASRTELTDAERAWVRENRVSVGIEAWPPIVFMENNGRAGGLAGDYLRLLANKTGLRFDFIGGPWDALLTGLRNREIDLLPATYFTDERATYGLYTEPYFHMREFLYVRSDNTKIGSMDELRGKRLAIGKMVVVQLWVSALYQRGL